MTVHLALPPGLTASADAVLASAGIRHVAHGDGDPMEAATTAAGDPSALAMIGPYRSADVAEALEATAPVGLPLLAPMATWAGVTRDDEPGCDDAASHRGTVLRMVARDTVVAERISRLVRRADSRAVVVAGDHEYGRQLDGQLRLADLPRTEEPSEADLVVLAGLVDQPEIAQAAALSPLPLIAFDGVQGAQLGAGRDARVALPLAPQEGTAPEPLLAGTRRAAVAAEMVVAALEAGARNRATLLREVRARGPFDSHGDPIDPPVWLWSVGEGGRLEPDQPI
jgi:hypothetical protein